jgi:hypothetical protein
MPRYIARGGEQAFAAPFMQTGTKLSGWLVPADPAKQQAVVDRYLNAPMEGASGFTYRAMMQDLMFAIAPIEATRSTTLPDSNFGYTPETDVAFWMLVGRGHQDGAQWVLDQLLWYLPYVFVDIPMTVVTGREVYGYPKELAYLTWPKDETDPLVLAAETYVLPVYDKTTKLVRAPILEVQKTGSKEGLLERIATFLSVGHALEHLGVRAIEHPDATIDLLKILAEDLFRLEVPMVFLKEFRDVVDPLAACYQVILESPARVDGMPSGWPTFEEVAITIYDYASHPIATELGLGTPVDGKLTVKVPIGVQVNFDFAVELGTIMWP